MHAQLLECLTLLQNRSSGGKARGGRYLKPDSARRHFINSVALPALQRGVVPSDHDMAMLFGPAPEKKKQESRKDKK